MSFSWKLLPEKYRTGFFEDYIRKEYDEDGTHPLLNRDTTLFIINCADVQNRLRDAFRKEVGFDLTQDPHLEINGEGFWATIAEPLAQIEGFAGHAEPIVLGDTDFIVATKDVLIASGTIEEDHVFNMTFQGWPTDESQPEAGADPLEGGWSRERAGLSGDDTLSDGPGGTG